LGEQVEILAAARVGPEMPTVGRPSDAQDEGECTGVLNSGAIISGGGYEASVVLFAMV
jgi:hypothetical protein